ncbi:hypothetical protein O0L34_g5279 [Tuta absoluta]|nr:hypothetical protein O0L34_g5279 [Tuta absoluta]
MLFFSALALGVVTVTGLQNVTEGLQSDATEAVTAEMGLVVPTKLSDNPVLDHVNVTIQDRAVASMWDMYLNHCPRWRPINHIFFQVANICFLMSFLAPHTQTGLLWLRIALILGCSFYALWAWSIECYLDAVLWNGAFILINFVYFAVQFYLLRPIKFHKDIEEVSYFYILSKGFYTYIYK